MSGFLYYTSTKAKPSDTLGYAFDGGKGTSRGCTNGPDGKSGNVYAPPYQWDGAEHRIGYFADKQTWMQEGDWWVGRYNEPCELSAIEREKQLAGKHVKLGDGQRWHVPIARSFDHAGQHVHIPRTFTRANGEWVYGACSPAYQRLWTATEEHLNKLYESAGNGKLEVLIEDALEISVIALQANYCVAEAEVALLGLLNDQACQTILDVVVDLSGLNQIQKKTDFDTSSTSDGKAA